jgi:hypothetical protein
VELVLRGIGPAILRRYLRQLGAEEGDGACLVGDGWTARVVASDPILIGSVRLGQSVVTLAGDDATVRAVAEELKAKVLRIGG